MRGDKRHAANLPDISRWREARGAAGTTGLDVAKSISPSLAKRTVAMSLDGKLADLAAPIKSDASIKFLTRDDPDALELIRHDAAHVMAEAVQELYPGTQVTIGPVIDNGFYYDFARDEPFTPDDLAKIEAKMAEIIARDSPFTCEVVDRERRQGDLQEEGRGLQARADRRDPGTATRSSYTLKATGSISAAARI